MRVHGDEGLVDDRADDERLARRDTTLGVSFELGIVGLPRPASKQRFDAKLRTVLASDVSRSVDTRKFELQRQGYAAALSNPRVIEAIKSGPHGRIAICFVEWSGATSQKLVIDYIHVCQK